MLVRTLEVWILLILRRLEGAMVRSRKAKSFSGGPRGGRPGGRAGLPASIFFSGVAWAIGVISVPHHSQGPFH